MADTGSSSIRTDRLERHFPMGAATIRAVDGISLEIAAGGFVALLGSSGCGKSSLLNLLAGLDRPTGGAVIVDGRNLADMSGEELSRYRRHRVGMVFQAFNLIPTMTLLENVELPMRFAEVERSQRQGLAREALERVGLGARLAHRPAELSGGEQQRAAIARALVNRPSLLLADEPTGNLDSRTGSEILDLLHESNEKFGMTVIMVTHEQSLAERYAERLVFLSDGKVVADRAHQPSRKHAARSSAGELPGRRSSEGEPVKAGDLVELATRNLRESVFRNSLTTLGIGVGVASLVAMLSLGIGLQQLANRRLERSGLFDTIMVTSRRGFRGFERRGFGEGPSPAESRVLDENCESGNRPSAQRARGLARHPIRDRASLPGQAAPDDGGGPARFRARKRCLRKHPGTFLFLGHGRRSDFADSVHR